MMVQQRNWPPPDLGKWMGDAQTGPLRCCSRTCLMVDSQTTTTTSGVGWWKYTDKPHIPFACWLRPDQFNWTGFVNHHLWISWARRWSDRCRSLSPKSSGCHGRRDRTEIAPDLLHQRCRSGNWIRWCEGRIGGSLDVGCETGQV